MKAPSRYSGPIPPAIWDVLTVAWEASITLQSNYARAHPLEIALAASVGWISNVDPDGSSYRNHWRITASGLTALQNKDLFD